MALVKAPLVPGVSAVPFFDITFTSVESFLKPDFEYSTAIFVPLDVL
jgi:hypothetical protein